MTFGPLSSYPMASPGSGNSALRRVTSVTPVAVSAEGGETITITGDFLVGDCEVFLVSGSREIPCYSGLSGRRNTITVATAGTLQCTMPAVPEGPLGVIVRQSSREYLGGSLAVAYPPTWPSPTFGLRASFTTKWRTGPRSLDGT